MLFSLKAQESLNMTLLSQWSDSTIPPTSFFNSPYNEIWGYATNDAEYAIIGSTMGTHFIDVSDPSNITEVAFVEGAATGTSIVHRDFHDYNGYLYAVCDEGASTLQIMDLSYLPDSVPLVYDDNSLIKKAHNVFIDEATGKLYGIGVSPVSGSFVGVRIISLADPIAPVLLDDMLVGSGVHDVFVRNDTIYVNRGGSGLAIYDVSDASDPILLGSLVDYEGQGYNHAGYLSDDGNTYVLADETHGSPIKMLDVSDLSDIEIISTVTSGVAESSIPHNPLIKGDLMYSSYYYDGVYIWDISDPLNPELVGFYDTSEVPNGNGFQGCWGVYPFLPSGLVLASDMQEGLFVMEIDQVTNVDENHTGDFGFNLFPNPSVDFCYLAFDNEKQESYQINIYSMSGRLVLSENTIMSTTQISTQELSKGVYFVELKGKTITTKKLIIK
jgi:choice-of-anchor B domain-containing protein